MKSSYNAVLNIYILLLSQIWHLINFWNYWKYPYPQHEKLYHTITHMDKTLFLWLLGILSKLSGSGFLNGMLWGHRVMATFVFHKVHRQNKQQNKFLKSLSDDIWALINHNKKSCNYLVQSTYVGWKFHASSKWYNRNETVKIWFEPKLCLSWRQHDSLERLRNLKPNWASGIQSEYCHFPAMWLWNNSLTFPRSLTSSARWE